MSQTSEVRSQKAVGRRRTQGKSKKEKGKPKPRSRLGNQRNQGFPLLLIDRDSPEINIGGQTVPVVERVRIVRFVTQLVVPCRQGDLLINFPVLVCATCVRRLRRLHLPHA